MNSQQYIEAEFLNYLNNLGYSKTTVNTYRVTINRFIAKTHESFRYEYKDIINFLDNLTDYNKRTKRSYLNAIKLYYDYLLEKGIRSNHPCRNLYIKGKDNRDVIHSDLFTMSELEELMEREERFPEFTIRNKVIISLLIYQGLAINEIENLKLYHIDLDKGLINIPASRSLIRRSLEMNRIQYPLFYKYINEERPRYNQEYCDYFILNKVGTGIKKLSIAKILRSMQYKFSYKTVTATNIRKSVISYWLNQRKYPLEQVQLMSGHKWITSTEKYRFKDVDEERELINRWFPE